MIVLIIWFKFKNKEIYLLIICAVPLCLATLKQLWCAETVRRFCASQLVGVPGSRRAALSGGRETDAATLVHFWLLIMCKRAFEPWFHGRREMDACCYVLLSRIWFWYLILLSLLNVILVHFGSSLIKLAVWCYQLSILSSNYIAFLAWLLCTIIN